MESQGKSSRVFELFQKHASDLLTSADDQILSLILEAGSVSFFTDLVEQDYNNFYKKMMNCPDLMNAIYSAVDEELRGNDKINETESFNMIDDISSSASSSSIISEKDDDNIILLNEDKWEVPKADMERAVKESLEISRRVEEIDKKARTAEFFGTLDKNGFDKEDIKKVIEESKKEASEKEDVPLGLGMNIVTYELDKLDMKHVLSVDAKRLMYMDEFAGGGLKQKSGSGKKARYVTKKPSLFKRFCNWVKSLFAPSIEKQVRGLVELDLLSRDLGGSVPTMGSEHKNKDYKSKDLLVRPSSGIEGNVSVSNSSNTFNGPKSVEVERVGEI